MAAGELMKGLLRMYEVQVMKSQALLQGGSASCCTQAQKILKRRRNLRGQFSNVLPSARKTGLLLGWQNLLVALVCVEILPV